MTHLNDLGSRTVVLERLPDKSGRVRIHWFQRCDDGPAVTPDGVLPSNRGPVPSGGVRGRIACQPRRTSVLPTQDGAETRLLAHSDDVRAVTCPACRGTKAYWEAMVAVTAAAGAELSGVDAIAATAAGVSLEPAAGGAS